MTPETDAVLPMTFAILVTCADENDQAGLMKQFDELGLSYRALMT
jgi:hypothetical protein